MSGRPAKVTWAHAVGLGAVAMTAVSLAGCSTGGAPVGAPAVTPVTIASTANASPTPTAPQSPPSSSSPPSPPSPTPSTTSPSPSTTPAPRPTVPPESVLPRLRGLTYARGASTDEQVIDEFIKSNPEPALVGRVLTGILVRQIRSDRGPVGFVELLQANEQLAADPRFAEILPDLTEAFARTEPTRSAIGKVTTWEVERARGSGISAVAFKLGRDIILIGAPSLADARRLARSYIDASPPGSG